MTDRESSTPQAAALEPALLAGRAPREILTERLLMRPPRLADAAAVNRAIVESEAEISPWLPWAVPLPEVADTEAFCERAAREFTAGTSLAYLLFERNSGEFVGGCGIPRLDWAAPMFELGYWCSTRYSGSGFIREATLALARMAFADLGAARLELRIEPGNRRSRALATRLGFVEEACLRRCARNTAGELTDLVVYVCFRPEHLAPG